MNYYKRHLGDYAAATRHLTMLEHGAYTLLLDLYYVSEKPIPADERAVFRLVGARSKDEREAVKQVLEEFFELRGDGWHQTRCDLEIAEAKEVAEGSVGKKENERERQRRYRERRKAMFEFLRERDVVPPWDIPMTELEALVRRYENAPVTRDSNAPQTQTITANHKPLANSHKPLSNQQPPSTPPTESRARAPLGRSEGEGEYLPDPTPYGALSATLRKLGVPCMPNDSCLRAWVDEGFSANELTAAVEIVRQTKPAPQPIPPKYLDTTVRRLREEAAKPKPQAKEPPWWTSEAGIDRKARELGMYAYAGETYDAFRTRIFAEIKRRETAQGATA